MKMQLDMNFTAQETYMDKSEWARGQWDNEPDKAQWVDEATGLDCLIVRNPVGALCGYVGVPANHPWHGIGYSRCTRPNECTRSEDSFYCDHSPDMVTTVHGGLTYSDKCAGHICHNPKLGANDGVWWFGFDCAHSGDICPGSRFLTSLFSVDETYRDIGYVREQCASLARQLKEIAQPG